VAVNRSRLDGGSEAGAARVPPESRTRASGAAPRTGPPDAFRGRSPVVAGFLERLGRAAASEATVLLTGESGCGKSSAAARLHRASPRARGPLVSASLVASSATLIESTLFGHERGAFTDAHRDRTGLFRRAEGGTLVLEEVDHLPLELQVKLLRVLQEREVEPLGAEVPVPIDVRVVATSSVSLARAVEAGTFREDLYYRLAVLELEVPPLRTRLEDLEALLGELLPRVARRVGAAARPFGPEALERLGRHGWPGNVRELENTIERVLVLGPDGGVPEGPIGAGELDFLFAERGGALEDLARSALALGATADEVARAMMERALAEHRGNVSAAARAVGMTRRAFEYRRNRDEESSGS
jgi:DNA-binding NtrC family response regulator